MILWHKLSNELLVLFLFFRSFHRLRIHRKSVHRTQHPKKNQNKNKNNLGPALGLAVDELRSGGESTKGESVRCV